MKITIFDIDFMVTKKNGKEIIILEYLINLTKHFNAAKQDLRADEYCVLLAMCLPLRIQCNNLSRV